jgi:GxxExxY protein
LLLHPRPCRSTKPAKLLLEKHRPGNPRPSEQSLKKIPRRSPIVNIEARERAVLRTLTEQALKQRALTERVIGLAIEVHRTIGPGLLESVYAECLCLELGHAGIPFESQVAVPITYKEITIPVGFRADIVVERAIILEVKAVATLLPAHQTQLLTYLRMSGISVGLLMNFHAGLLKDGLLRLVL